MFVTSSSEPLPSLFKLCLGGGGGGGGNRGCHMIVLLEVLHLVDFINVTHVKS